MNTVWNKLWCVILSLALLINLLPVSTLASEAPLEQAVAQHLGEYTPVETTENVTQLVATESAEESQAVIVREDISLREEFTKHFEMSDGSYTATVYNEPVHQLVDGAWVEVDNTLTLSTSAKGTATYQTVNGLTDVSFAQSFVNELVTMEQDSHSITWGVEATIEPMETAAVASAQLIGNLKEPVQAEILPLDLSDVAVEEQKIFATKATSTIQYADALANGVDLEYTVLPSRIKESIILNSPQSISAYTVTVNTSDLLARLLDNREVEFYAEDGETVFTMWAPYMYDSASELSEDIAVELTALGSGQYAVTLTPDAAWLNSPDRVYPIVIDPDVSVSRARTNIIDNTVMEGQGNQNRNLDRLYIGRKSGARVRAFLKYDVMPTIPFGATITDAKQTLYITSGTDTGSTAGAYIVTGGDWASDTITWANRPTAATTIQATISHNNFSYYHFSCLSAVQKWYTGSTIGKNENYGITVRYTDETINDYNAFYSGDCSTESNRPLLVIRYTVNSGGTGGGNSYDSAVALELGYAKSLSTVSAGELRYFKFTPTETASYIFQSSNSSGDPMMWLFDSNHVPLGTGNTGAGLNFRYNHSLTAGRTYYIAAGHADSKTGSYCITVLKPATQANVENGFYYIQNRGTALYLDIHGPGEQKYVHQWTMHSDEQEKWLIQRQSDGYWTIRSQFGNRLYVGINDSNTGINNVQLFSSIFDQTRWNLHIAYDGTFIFEPKTALGKVMCAPNSYAGSEMILEDMGDGGSCAKWVISVSSYSGLTFSAFDIGNSASDEVAIVKSHLDNMGYTDIGTYDNTDGIILPRQIKDVSRFSDIVYLNGHGYPLANLQVRNAANEPIGWLCADDSIDTGDEHEKIEIGAEWKNGSTSITESCWNNRTKWVILAQCSQFNLDSEGEGNHWNGLNSAEVWSRTMLGDGARLHGFLGYYDLAPPETHHITKLKRFLSYAQDRTIVTAWKDAHASILGIDTNWAVMYHSSNRNDQITSFTPSTYPGSSDTIILERREIPAETSNTSVAHAATSGSYPVFIDDSEVKSTESLHTALLSKLSLNQDDTLELDENNCIVFKKYRNHAESYDLSFEISDSQAVEVAIQKLDQLELLPDGEYRTSVSYIRRYRTDPNEQEFGSPETIECTVSFYRTHNGIDVLSNQEDGIIVSFDKYGLTELRYKWRDIKKVEVQQSLKKSLVTQEYAKGIYQAVTNQNNNNTGAKISNNVQDPIITSAYLQLNDEVRPVWVCSPNGHYGSHVFVDKLTGEVISI